MGSTPTAGTNGSEARPEAQPIPNRPVESSNLSTPAKDLLGVNLVDLEVSPGYSEDSVIQAIHIGTTPEGTLPRVNKTAVRFMDP